MPDGSSECELARISYALADVGEHPAGELWVRGRQRICVLGCPGQWNVMASAAGSIYANGPLGLVKVDEQSAAVTTLLTPADLAIEYLGSDGTTVIVTDGMTLFEIQTL
jgi:hypothetical protein